MDFASSCCVIDSGLEREKKRSTLECTTLPQVLHSQVQGHSLSMQTFSGAEELVIYCCCCFCCRCQFHQHQTSIYLWPTQLQPRRRVLLPQDKGRKTHCGTRQRHAGQLPCANSLVATLWQPATSQPPLDMFGHCISPAVACAPP